MPWTSLPPIPTGEWMTWGSKEFAHWITDAHVVCSGIDVRMLAAPGFYRSGESATHVCEVCDSIARAAVKNGRRTRLIELE